MASPAVTSIVLGTVGAMAGYDMAAMNGACTGIEWQGAAIGWSIGSAIGASMAELPPVQGPRMADLKFQSSQYGDMIPIVYGTSRISGQVIWSSDIIETSNTTTVGGKGGGGQEQTSYSYSINCAIALCEGVISGIDNVWANGKLVGNIDNSWGSGSGYSARLYLGDETQLPDALLESYLGVGNVPAHRGMAYIVLENFQLEKYGNRLPNITFEVIKNGALNATNLPQYFGPQDDGSGHVINAKENPYVTGQLITFTSMSTPSSVTIKFVVYDWINGTEQTIDTGIAIVRARMTGIGGGAFCLVECTQEFWLPIDRLSGATVAVAINLLSLSVRNIDVQSPTIWALPNNTAGAVVCFYNKESQTVSFHPSSSTGGNYNILDPKTGSHGSPRTGGGVFETICKGSNTNAFSAWGAGIIKFIGGDGIVNGSASIIGGASNSPLSFDSRRRRYASKASDRVAGFSTFVTIDESSLAVTYYDSGVPTGKSLYYYNEYLDKYYYTGTAPSPAYHNFITFVDPETFQIIETVDLPSIPYTMFNPIYGIGDMALCINDPNHIVFYTGYIGNSGIYIIRCELKPSVTATSPTVAAVVTDICSKVGLAAGDINVANLTSITIGGIAIANRAPARQSIESLQSAYFFDAVESD